MATPRWTLSATALAALLRRLDADERVAAEKYEALRLTLRGFFRWKGDPDPDPAVDETLDRMARRLERGEPIEDVPSFARGVARMVRLERQRQPLVLGGDAVPEQTAAPPFEESQWATCLDRCLGGLPADERAFILDYYAGQGATRIARRAALARAEGLSDNALRHRAQRLRDRLRTCGQQCVEGAASATASANRRHETYGFVSRSQKGRSSDPSRT